jgi:hypothetical protein
MSPRRGGLTVNRDRSCGGRHLAQSGDVFYDLGANARTGPRCPRSVQLWPRAHSRGSVADRGTLYQVFVYCDDVHRCYSCSRVR